MEHPMEAGLTLGAAVEQFNLFSSDKLISFDNRNSKFLKRHYKEEMSCIQRKRAKLQKLKVKLQAEREKGLKLAEKK